MDKINTETSISEMQAEVNEVVNELLVKNYNNYNNDNNININIQQLRAQNDREANQLDALFEQKQQLETNDSNLSCRFWN